MKIERKHKAAIEAAERRFEARLTVPADRQHLKIVPGAISLFAQIARLDAIVNGGRPLLRLAAVNGITCACEE